MIIQAAERLKVVKEYYFSSKLRQISAMKAAGIDVINVGIGSPDLLPSDETLAALIDTAQQKNSHGYQSYSGIPELRQAIANWYQKCYGCTLNYTNEVLPLMGSKEGIMHISMAFLNPDDGVLVPNPGYLTYSSVANLLGAKVLPYRLLENNNWLPDFEALEKQDLTKVKLMWVNYPNMPTGADASTEVFEQLVNFAKKHQILIVNDNPYSLVLNDKPKSVLSVEAAKEVAIELNSLSKSHNMAGWRIGMLVGHKDYLNLVLKVKSNMDSGMFLGLQKAAIAALNNTVTWHQIQNEVYQKRKKIALQILSELNCTAQENQVGLFVWAKVPNNILSVTEWLDKLLLQARVFITPGFIFGTAGANYVRIALCSEAYILQEVLQRVKVFSKTEEIKK